MSTDFIAITRSSGQERNRDELLDDISNPKKPNLRRELDAGKLWVRSSDTRGIVRSIVTTIDQTDSPPERFRNTHLFEKQQGRWLCVAWQVTKMT